MLATHGLLLALGLAAPPAPDDRDTLELKGGKTLHGRVLLATGDHVVFRVRSSVKSYARDDVVAYTSVADRHRELLAQLARIRPNDLAELLRLAEFCREHRLPHEERLLYWRVLLVDREHAEANERLGHKKSRKGWRTRLGSRWVAVADLDAALAKSGDGLELRSEHVELRCAGGLRRAVQTAFELEYLYRHFYEIFQRDLGLYELVEPFEVSVYRDRDSYPSAAGAVGAYFAPGENRVYTYLHQGAPYALFHEATHALLFNVNENSVGSRGDFPAWLDEAIADHLQTVVQARGDGVAVLDAEEVAGTHLRTLETADRVYTVQRVLNFKADDFGATSRQHAKYAQSYVLFHYMLFASEHRARFLEYIRTAMLGKGQASTFRKMFRRELEEIERGHLEYAGR